MKTKTALLTPANTRGTKLNSKPEEQVSVQAGLDGHGGTSAQWNAPQDPHVSDGHGGGGGGGGDKPCGALTDTPVTTPAKAPLAKSKTTLAKSGSPATIQVKTGASELLPQKLEPKWCRAISKCKEAAT